MSLYISRPSWYSSAVVTFAIEIQLWHDEKYSERKREEKRKSFSIASQHRALLFLHNTTGWASFLCLRSLLFTSDGLNTGYKHNHGDDVRDKTRSEHGKCINITTVRKTTIVIVGVRAERAEGTKWRSNSNVLNLAKTRQGRLEGREDVIYYHEIYTVVDSIFKMSNYVLWWFLWIAWYLMVRWRFSALS